jgi:hypothetical protein
MYGGASCTKSACLFLNGEMGKGQCHGTSHHSPDSAYPNQSHPAPIKFDPLSYGTFTNKYEKILNQHNLKGTIESFQ